MRDVSNVITKKYYNNKREFQKNSGKELYDRPAWLKAVFIFFVALSGFGEWKAINSAVGGLPKAISAAVIAMAIIYCIVCTDFKNLKRVLKPYGMYLLLILLIILWLIVIWLLNFTDISSITRAGEKLTFQFVSITVAVSAIYLFGVESIDLFFYSMCISNGAIMAMEAMNYGVAESVQSLIQCIVTFGDAVDFTRAIEIHELTFLFGQFMVYYAAFAPSKTRQQIKKRIICFILSTFFFLAGIKRIAVLAVGLAIIFALVMKRFKKIGKILISIGIVFFVFYFYFLSSVRDGSFTNFMEKLGVDMMGRSYIWYLTKQFYQLSPTFMGLGFEAVDAIAKGWVEDGTLQAAFMFHNDILKVFVELGFPGFCIWSLVQYVIYPIFFIKAYDTKTCLLYISVLIYISITYMTDNTAFYFWCTMGLRLIPLAYAFRIEPEEEEPKWTPPDKNSVKQLVHNAMT